MSSFRRRSLGKRLLKVLLALLAVLAVALIGGYFWAKQRFAAKPNQLQHLSSSMSFAFEWEALDEGDLNLPYAAMLVPVTIGACDHLLMQFDLGATSSVLYREIMVSLEDRCSNPITVDSDRPNHAVDMNIDIGGSRLHAADIRLRNVGGAGVDGSNPDQRVVVGTLGSDLIEGKLLVIDYPAKRIIIGDQLPDGYAAPNSWGRFTFEDRRIMLASQIDGRDTRLYFDTGSSAFELLTSTGIWTGLALPSATPEVLTVNSWGRPLTVYRVASGKSIDVAGVQLPLRHVSRVEGASFMQNLLGRVINMGGMTGNALFVDHVLVLDTRHGKVGVTANRSHQTTSST